MKTYLLLATFTLVLAGCGRAPQAGQPVSVDAVVSDPGKFTGPIAVAGRVAQVEPGRGLFVLGCDDACVAMPVQFAGTLPATGREVIVRGQITRDAQGRYVFAAQAVEQP